MFKRAFAVAFALIGVFILASPASADDYPSRTVTIVVPYPAGGPTDQAARQIAQSLSQQLKQNFIVEDITGGGTIIATNHVAKAAPDGYTLLMHNLQISANVTLYKKLPFDTEKDLTTVMLINRNPLVLVGRKDLEANSLEQLIALMKKKTLRAAIPGYGATGHLATTLLAQLAKVKLLQVPYRGAAPALVDILGGHVDIFFSTPQAVVKQIAAGQMKAYGITSKETSPLFPKVESFVKVFGPKMEFHYWQALFAPAKTPPAVIAKLNAALQKTVQDPKLLKLWAATGVEPFPKAERTTAAGNAMLKSEIARWGAVIRDNNIHVNQ